MRPWSLSAFACLYAVVGLACGRLGYDVGVAPAPADGGLEESVEPDAAAATDGAAGGTDGPRADLNGVDRPADTPAIPVADAPAAARPDVLGTPDAAIPRTDLAGSDLAASDLAAGDLAATDVPPTARDLSGAPAPDLAPPDAAGCSDPLTTDFSSMPAWATAYERRGAHATVATGYLEVRLSPAGGGSYAGLRSAPIALQARRISVEVPAMVDVTGTARAYVFFCPFDTAVCETTLDLFALVQEQGRLYALAPGIPQLASVPYDPTAHRFWQFRAQNATLSYETSPDGTRWTSLASIAAPPSLAAVQLWMGAWDNDAPNAGEVHFDNLTGCAAP